MVTTLPPLPPSPPSPASPPVPPLPPLTRAALGSSPRAVADLVVRPPDHLAALASLSSSEDLDDGKRWARWRVIQARAPWLPEALVAADFAFYGRRLTGAEQITKVGSPTKWRDYSKLVTDRADLDGNYQRGYAVNYDRELAKLGDPVDRDEWFMTAQTVNAHDNPGKALTPPLRRADGKP
jgi:predicted metalloendopeptidase